MKSSLDATLKVHCYSSTNRVGCSTNGVVANICNSTHVEFNEIFHYKKESRNMINISKNSQIDNNIVGNLRSIKIMSFYLDHEPNLKMLAQGNLTTTCACNRRNQKEEEEEEEVIDLHNGSCSSCDASTKEL
jgi:hypothetical protein